MGTKQDCENGLHTPDNDGACHWCGKYAHQPTSSPVNVKQLNDIAALVSALNAFEATSDLNIRAVDGGIEVHSAETKATLVRSKARFLSQWVVIFS